jgi:hypothetical protein
MTVLRTFQVITVCKDHFTKEYKIKLNKDLTETEAKTYIRIAIQNDGIGVMMSRTFPSAYPEFNNLTKTLANKYIKVMNENNFKKTLKIYDELETAGLKVGINF